MSDARAEILGRVRAALGSSTAKPFGAPCPDVLATSERSFDAGTFIQRAGEVGATVREATGAAAVPAVVAEILTALGARTVAVSGAPVALTSIDAFDGKVLKGEVSRAALFACDAGVTGAQLAIAETGTVVLFSDVERHRLTSLVPDVHIALVERSSIVPTLDDAMRAVSCGPNSTPRCVTFISGPSRTADIELELVVGVHGPRELYIVLY